MLAILTAMALPAFDSALNRRALLESADQLRSLMYFASAESRRRGRRIEIRFTDPPPAPLLEGRPAATSVEVRIESDPMGAPGEFVPLQASWTDWRVAGNKVQVTDVRVADPLPRSGRQSPAIAEPDAADGAVDLPVIVFGFDGRSAVGEATVTLRDDRGGYDVTIRATTGQASLEPALPLDEEGNETGNE